MYEVAGPVHSDVAASFWPAVEAVAVCDCEDVAASLVLPVQAAANAASATLLRSECVCSRGADSDSPSSFERRDEIANIARRTGLCADIEVLVDHPAIDPENGARMDVRNSKPGVQNADELIDVQVTSPFSVQAAGLVGKAATIAESKKRTKYRPAVVTPAILETLCRMGPTLKAFLAKIAPEDQQAQAAWLQEARRRISCVLQIHNARIIAKCNGTI